MSKNESLLLIKTDSAPYTWNLNHKSCSHVLIYIRNHMRVNTWQVLTTRGCFRGGNDSLLPTHQTTNRPRCLFEWMKYNAWSKLQLTPTEESLKCSGTFLLPHTLNLNIFWWKNQETSRMSFSRLRTQLASTTLWYSTFQIRSNISQVVKLQ